MLCLIYLRANLRNGVSPCGRKCFWLRLLLVSWLVPPFPFKRPRQMPLGAAAISSPRQDTPTITRRERRSSTTARVNGSCTKLPIGVVLRRRPNLSKWQGIRGPRGSPFHLASHGGAVSHCPLCPQKRTFVEALSMSALCQKQTLAADGNCCSSKSNLPRNLPGSLRA
jgi:hypothetical protein